MSAMSDNRRKLIQVAMSDLEELEAWASERISERHVGIGDYAQGVRDTLDWLRGEHQRPDKVDDLPW